MEEGNAEPKIINVSHLNLVQLENTFYDAIGRESSRKYSKQK
jgi:uncharacterized protein YecE (DUF72 family)